MSLTYRHYGSSKFIPEFLTPVTRSRTMKPVGGLWASPIYSKNSWYDFCIHEQYRKDLLNECFDFKLQDTAKILQINSFEDVQNMIHRFPGRMMDSVESVLYSPWDSNITFRFKYFPDYVEIAKKYDGVEVSITNCPSLYYWMYTWDVDSIVIWNSDMISIV